MFFPPMGAVCLLVLVKRNCFCSGIFRLVELAQVPAIASPPPDQLERPGGSGILGFQRRGTPEFVW